jgi:HEAT repeat protein
MGSLSSVQKTVAIVLAALAISGWGYAFMLSADNGSLKAAMDRAEQDLKKQGIALAKLQRDAENAKAALERNKRSSSASGSNFRDPRVSEFLSKLKSGEVTLDKSKWRSNDEVAGPEDSVASFRAMGADLPEDRDLDAMLASEDPNEREGAVEALAESGRPDALELLGLSLSDVDEDVREAAMGGDEAAEVLAAGLGDPEAWNREEALAALAKIGGDKAAHSLAVALRVKDTALRKSAVEGLGEIGGEEAVKVLELALRDKDPAVRQAAVEALEEIGGATAMKLIESAKDNMTETIQ